MSTAEEIWRGTGGPENRATKVADAIGELVAAGHQLQRSASTLAEYKEFGPAAESRMYKARLALIAVLTEEFPS